MLIDEAYTQKDGKKKVYASLNDSSTEEQGKTFKYKATMPRL